MRLLRRHRRSSPDRDHIVPQSRGGTNRVSNLTLACAACNQAKGDLTALEFGHPEVQARAAVAKEGEEGGEIPSGGNLRPQLWQLAAQGIPRPIAGQGGRSAAGARRGPARRMGSRAARRSFSFSRR